MFKSERYSIEVYDDRIEFYGIMPLSEMHQWIDHFQELGFDTVDQGSENSSLIISKSNGQEQTVFRAEHQRTIEKLKLKEQELEDSRSLNVLQKQHLLKTLNTLNDIEQKESLKNHEISKLKAHVALLTHILESNHVQVVLEDECNST